MRKNLSSFILLAMVSGLVLASCNDNLPQGSTEITSGSNSPISESNGDSFSVKDFGTPVQGQRLDLSDYISVVDSQGNARSVDWDYDILRDGTSLPVIETVSSSDLNVKKSKVVELTGAGHAVIRAFRGPLSRLISFEVQEDVDYARVLNAFQDTDFKSYTINQGFSIGADLKVQASSPSPILLKGEDFTYSTNGASGLAFHKSNGYGYPFFLDGVTGKDETFLAVPAGKFEDKETLSQFNSTYQPLSSYFNSSTVVYSSFLENLFGKEYRFGFPNLESNSNLFSSTLNALGIAQTQAINGTTYGVVFLIPKIDEGGNVSLYTLLSDSSYANVFLAGPYTISDVDSTTLAPVEKFVHSPLPTSVSDASAITNKLQGLKSYTATATAEYLDLDGKVLDSTEVPAMFTDVNPTFKNVLKVTENAFETSLFKANDSSTPFDHVILQDIQEGGTTKIKQYSVDGNGKATDQGYFNSVSSSGWKQDFRLSGSTPSLLFRDSNFLNASYWIESDGSYLSGGLKDAGETVGVKALMAGLAGPLYVDASSAYDYFAQYSWLRMNIGKTNADDVSGEVKMRFMGNGKTYVYHFTFQISSLNSTTIDINV